MNSKFLTIVFLSFFWFFCSAIPLIDHRKEINIIVKKYLKEMYVEYNILPIGIGSASPSDYQYPIISFLSDRDLNTDQTRKLFINLASNLLEKFNNNKSIRPFLHDYPMTLENLQLSIGFEKKNLNSNSIAYVSIVKGNIFYRKNDAIKKSYIMVHEESCYDALKKIKDETNYEK